MLNAIHPYWRYEYAAKFNAGKAEKDPFANIKAADPKKRWIVAKGKVSCLMLNAFPYAPGHMMALPYRAVANLEDLTDEEAAELHDFIVIAKLLLQKVLKIDGLNVGLNQGRVSGGSVPTHLHWQIVPRWMGDHNFMPVIGSTRLLTVSQQAVWKALKKAYEQS